MTPDRRSPPADGSRSRQRELRAKLSAAGLLRRRFRGSSTTEILGADRSPASRLGELLNHLGPLFAAFREYLSLRADLLPLPDCHDLSQPGATPPAIGRQQAMGLLRRELGDEADLLILTLSEPQRGNALFQWYGAELPDGSPVTLKLLRPELQNQIARDTTLIPTLADIHLLAQDGSVVDMAAATAGFSAYLARRMDLAAEARELEQMAESAADFDSFAVARVHPALCSDRVVTVDTFPGARPLADELPASQDLDLGRRLALLWLQQALLGGLYPDAPLEDEISLMPDQRLVVNGGRFGRLDHGQRGDLLRYLTASARDEMDRSCELLLDQCDSLSGATRRARMQRLFRLAEPFRAGGWSQLYAGQRLSDTLFVQWRLVHGHRYRFKASQQAFARGLYDLERHCRRLAPERDGLRLGLDDVRVIAAAVRLREYLGPSALRENLHQLMQNGSLLLRRSADAASRRQRDDEDADKPPTGRRRDLPTLVFALLLIAACLTLIGARLLPAGALGETGEAMAAVLYTSVALAFFWHVGRSDTG